MFVYIYIYVVSSHYIPIMVGSIPISTASPSDDFPRAAQALHRAVRRTHLHQHLTTGLTMHDMGCGYVKTHVGGK